ncbi:MAG TPA: TIGR03067 domain-containing protein [Gemmataceae bacterium]|nr:TIGR03067 domain-containing protein [Gemmataceae bacterium]
MMRFLLGIVLLVGVVYGEEQPKEKAVDNDKEKLQGKWVLTSGIVDGKDRTKEWGKQRFTVVIQGDKMTFGPEKDKRTATFHIDPSRKPKTFDLFVSLGIYELKRDELKICLGGPKRPTEFTSKAGSDKVLYVFKRAKKREK